MLLTEYPPEFIKKNIRTRMDKLQRKNTVSADIIDKEGANINDGNDSFEASDTENMENTENGDNVHNNPPKPAIIVLPFIKKFSKPFKEA